MSDKLDLPWALEWHHEAEIRDGNGGLLIAERDHDEGYFVDLWEDQARLIVKAVNNHHALVDMVRELRMLVRVTGPLTTARERADKLLAALDADNAR